MFKPQTFRFKSTIHWPGIGPASEIAATNIARVDDEGDDYLFVHASGHAVRVPKAQVTAYGVYDADDVPNLPTPEDYKDGTNEASDNDSDSTRLAGNSTPLPTEPKGPETVNEDSDNTSDQQGEYGKSDQSGSAEASDKSTHTTSTDASDDDELQSSDDSYSTPADSDDAFEAPATDTEEAGSTSGGDRAQDNGTDSETNVYDADAPGGPEDFVQSDNDELGDSDGAGFDDNASDNGPADSDDTCSDENDVEPETESALSKFFSTSKKKSKKKK